jgi:hypothetical protein
VSNPTRFSPSSASSHATFTPAAAKRAASSSNAPALARSPGPTAASGRGEPAGQPAWRGARHHYDGQVGAIARAGFTRATVNVLLAALLVALGVSIDASSARAATTEVGCSALQSAINTVAAKANHGEGEVIVLDELCDGTNLGISSGVTLPAGSNFSIEGKAGTNAGFDGTGVTGSLLGTVGPEEAGTMTLSNLTFQHANLTGASALSIRAVAVTLSHDSFIENEERGGDGVHAAFVEVGHSGCPPASPPAITVTDSEFLKNKLTLENTHGGGGAAWLKDVCEDSRNVLEDNRFEGNVLEATKAAKAVEVTGAGLQFVGSEPNPAAVSQRGNVFDSNSLLAIPSAEGNYGGGGEWVENADLTSVGDRFSRNQLVGTDNAAIESWSWGAGLGIITPSCEGQLPELPASTLEDDVAAGNAIGPGTPVDLGGGGIWFGCLDLRVLDSTVTLNASPYGAGIEGEPEGLLEIANSIVAEDSTGDETYGITEPVKASFSDVCATASSSAPLPGSGNICANPLLADNGDPASFDVAETGSSPTIDAGSNALIPAGLLTDFYGSPRVVASHYNYPPCTSGALLEPTLAAPVVDMGAAEFGPVAVALAEQCAVMSEPHTQGSSTTGGSTTQGPATSKSSVFSLPSFLERRNNRLLLTFTGLAAGRLRVRATFKLARSVVAVIKGHRQRTSRIETVSYGQASYAVTSPGKATVVLTPTKRALAVLASRRRLRVLLSITFTAAGAAPSSREKTITVIAGAPAKHKR